MVQTNPSPMRIVVHIANPAASQNMSVIGGDRYIVMPNIILTMIYNFLEGICPFTVYMHAVCLVAKNGASSGFSMFDPVN